MPTALSRITARLAARMGYTPSAAAAAAVAAAQADAGRAAEQAAMAAGRRVQAAAMQHQRALIASLTTPDVASWQADGAHINASTAAGLAVARARSRDAAVNNGYARRFLGMVIGNVLGPHGVRYQARVRTAAGELRTSINDRLEAGWAAWGRRGVCDVTGRYTWRMVQRLALRGMAVDGEVFIRWVLGGPHGVQMHLLPADMVPVSYSADLGSGRKVRQGVELDAQGRVLAYYLRADDVATDVLGGAFATGTQRVQRVPAAEVTHLMLPEEPGQLRGVPWMAAALKRMYQAQDFAGAGLNKAREAAKRGGWIAEDPDKSEGTAAGLTDGTDAATGQAYAALHDGTWEKLPAGYTAQPFESNYPNIEYGQFIKDCLREIASSLDVAYITLGNDLEAVNYSSGQLGLEGERTLWLGLQRHFIEELVEEAHRRWLRYAPLAVPELAALDYARLDVYAAAARWQPHRWQPLDPLKTIEAQRSRIEARLTSPQRVIAEGGEDPDEIVAELIEWAAKTAVLGPMPAGSAAPAESNDPADQAATAAGRAARRWQLITSQA